MPPLRITHRCSVFAQWASSPSNGDVLWGLELLAAGGSARLPFSIVQPHQRLWDDVITQIGRWADLGLSLRQMQTEIGDQQSVRQPTALTLTSGPPVILLDAFWVDLLTPTSILATDALGRQRPVKAAGDVCILVALAV